MSGRRRPRSTTTGRPARPSGHCWMLVLVVAAVWSPLFVHEAAAASARTNASVQSNTVIHHLETVLQHAVVLPRGGGSLYEANPNYEPSSAFIQRNPVLLQDLEPQVFGKSDGSTSMNGPPTMLQQSYFPVQQQSSPGILNSIQVAFYQLHAASPAIAQTLATCLGVFLLWQVPALQSTLYKYFSCSRRNLAAGRWSGILLAAVSHQGLFHLAANIMGLVSIGVPVSQTLAATTAQWPVWPLLVGGALAGSVSFLAIADASSSCLGLSAVTLALLSFSAQLYPQNTMGVLLFGIIPVRLQAGKMLRVLLAWSVWGSWKSSGQQRRGVGRGGGAPVAHAAHLGGLLFGLAYHAAWVRRRQVDIWIRLAKKTVNERLPRRKAL